MMVFLAGRAAEQVVFGRITNGAANDLERVTQIARSMVFEFGHGRGRPVADDARRQLRALRGDEAHARLRAGPAHRPGVRGGAAAAPRSIGVALDRVAEALLEKETLDRGELEALLADIKPESRSSETMGTVRALPLRD